MNNEEFKTIILPQYKHMYRVAISVMKNDCEAMDAVQDAMLRLWEKRNQLKEISNIKLYCLNVIRNTCLNIIRDKKVSIEIDKVGDIESDEDINNTVEGKHLSHIVIKAMNRLPSDQKKVLQLSAFGGFSNADIAEVLGTTQGNVRVILSRARKNIRVLLSK